MEDIIPILIFVIIIFGSAIRKLIMYLANQTDSSQGQSRKGNYEASRDSIRDFLERIEQGAEQATSSARQQRQAQRKSSRQRQVQQTRQAKQEQESTWSEPESQAETSFPEASQPEFAEPSYDEVREAEEAASKAKEKARKKVQKQKRRKKKEGKPKKEKRAGAPVSSVLQRLRSARAGEKELKQAIVWYEVLNSPVALRRRPGHQPHVMERPQFGRRGKKEE